MKIRKMTATFGNLQNGSMELNDGLNVVCAPNESGKSTWCAFIKSMLYGVDSSAREKGGNKPDKLRYAPWSGTPMGGSMEVEYEGKELTITRSGRASAPMRDLSLTYTGTSQAVQGIAANVGETLLGVPKEVFERSAFIGQGKVSVGSSPELEKRIAAIVQTGDENASCTEADEKLRAGMRKRRFNRSGRLPEIEAQIDDARRKLAEIDAEDGRGAALRAALAQAVENRDAQNEKVSESRKESRREALDRLTQSRNRIRELEGELETRQKNAAEAEKALYSDFFGEASVEECAERVKNDVESIRDLEAELTDVSIRKGNKLLLGLFIALFVVFAAVGFAGREIFWETAMFWITYVGFGTCLIFAGLSVMQILRNKKLREIYNSAKSERDNILLGYNCSSAEEIEARLCTHAQLCRALEAAEKSREHAYAVLEAEKLRQAALDAEMLKDLDFTENGESAELTKRLREAENELRRIREESAAWEGRKTALGDRQKIEAHIAQLISEHELLTLEYEALSLASETLRQAGTEIQSRMTPKLSKRTAEIFSALTGGRYDSVALDRELQAVAKLEGDPLARESAFLSVGALDQLYLAVRLAICELALPEDKSCPIILDDALVNFDDERCMRALALLAEMAKTRQIILFTCHEREAQMLERISL